ncbi:mitochondrial aspartate-tRNA ligase Dar2 [Schizosaccharomyces pombe]|uniref:Aspartate--tRNA ligase, mitochondrial n=1 Tax=Schizosaccharomyces pombe (strain 972 / ATCC 24843) TaxID=284812 RepID=SYDM_SCHPO|nr:putative aspartate--tRNA (Asp) ligase [Schizosaccharomyces pombe]O94242.1 RecName: Full=Aspartate--tRNA ligase, mitochondrial; AltName: Full=Aspartyl-tRNA synthetase; Short=AspRS; Flags: Precursor [Schizosaccharomyces pombe 972h-]CAA19270.1 mitochondrial aspartate-tRNA ligase (predicted) [Schizosaccharomyces pombe]|eukprot:NP_587777.1 putative aspartate--tRNA (Asp) ligase [Schizosaccharomyces pombe]
MVLSRLPACLLPLVGTKVSIQGWLVATSRQVSKSISFHQLRDTHGTILQLLSTDKIILQQKREPLVSSTDFSQQKSTSVMRTLSSIPPESVVQVTGKLQRRPEHDRRPGNEFELHVEDVKLLNVAKNLQLFPGDEKPGMRIQLANRHIQLRAPKYNSYLRQRSRLAYQVHSFFNDREFCEVETPLLFKSTPEGAREFVVPSRLNPGKFYALPQSPQQYKQILMASGIGNYYQIARCFRDEDLRFDRQPEFTQIDLEMSFVDKPHEIMEVVEDLLVRLVSFAKGITLAKPFQHITYQHAIDKYGSDKPDIRFELPLKNITSLLPKQDPLISTEILVYNDLSHSLSNAESRKLCEAVGENVVVTSIREHSQLQTWVKKLPQLRQLPIVAEELNQKLQIGINSIVFMTNRPKYLVSGTTPLGKLRLLLHELLVKKKALPELDKDLLKFVWVVDFPLFSPTEEKNQSITSTHHPFTAPHWDDVHLLEKKPLSVRGLHYDIVVNGIELGGGSIRIHNPDIQRFVLKDVLKLPENRYATFEHLIRVLSSGCPPHGGIALGFDRLAALLTNAPGIREVIAFPKTSSGADLLIGSPSAIPEEMLKDYNVAITRQTQNRN